MQKAMETKSRILDEIKKHGSFIIMGHVNPDGDTLGCAVALKLMLEAMGKDACVCIDGLVPAKLDFILKYTQLLNPGQVTGRIFDCAVSVDVASKERLGKLSQVYDAAETRINIDHHVSNEKFADLNWVEDRAAAGELVLELIEASGVAVTKEIANCIFAAVSTDTNSFVYSSVTGDTLRCAARTADYGADIAGLSDRIYFRRTFTCTKLISVAASRITLYAGGRIAATYICLEDYKATGSDRSESDVLINYVREIEGVEIALFFNQTEEDTYKVSLRSNGSADVGRFASSFGGGGHVKAAGFTVKGKISELYPGIIKKAEEYLT